MGSGWKIYAVKLVVSALVVGGLLLPLKEAQKVYGSATITLILAVLLATLGVLLGAMGFFVEVLNSVFLVQTGASASSSPLNGFIVGIGFAMYSVGLILPQFSWSSYVLAVLLTLMGWELGGIMSNQVVSLKVQAQ